MKNKTNKILACVAVALCALLVTFTVSASGQHDVTDYFSSSVEYWIRITPETSGILRDVVKTVTAEISEYYPETEPEVYVRAYIGGTMDSAEGAEADTGRKYGRAGLKATAVAIREDVLPLAISLYFPTGYAKCGYRDTAAQSANE